MIGLGTNAHVFARPHRREALKWCFEVALGCVPEVKHPGHPYYIVVPGGQVFTIVPSG